MDPANVNFLSVSYKLITATQISEQVYCNKQSQDCRILRDCKDSFNAMP